LLFNFSKVLKFWKSCSYVIINIKIYPIFSIDSFLKKLYLFFSSKFEDLYFVAKPHRLFQKFICKRTKKKNPKKQKKHLKSGQA